MNGNLELFAKVINSKENMDSNTNAINPPPSSDLMALNNISPEYSSKVEQKAVPNIEDDDLLKLMNSSDEKKDSNDSSIEDPVIIEENESIIINDDPFEIPSEIPKSDDAVEYAGEYAWSQSLAEANKSIFGNNSFRKYQKEIINASILGKDVIALIPTGGGKSLTFQLPAAIEQGLTVVIMPLISLIVDQMNYLKSINVNAVQLKGKMDKDTVCEVYDLIRNSMDLKLIYLTPEKLLNSESLLSLLDQMLERKRLNRFVVDEAHCISNWGKDFRKDYLALGFLKKRYPNVPVLALTGTANEIIKTDIEKNLSIKGCVFFRTSFNRPNLIYEVRAKTKTMVEEISQLIRTKHSGDSGIIYCNTKKKCQELSDKLKKYHINCDYYHASLPEEKRAQLQKDWMDDKITIIIATVALGMGINKKNVRFIIHQALPASLENYIQESGRAGRDGKTAYCILYYSMSDKATFDYITQSSKQGIRNKIYNVLDYCEEKYECRRTMMLHYLNETFSHELCYKGCDNCKNSLERTLKNYNTEARTIVSYVKDMPGRTLKQYVSLLSGKADKSNKNKGKKSDAGQGKKIVGIPDETVTRIFIKLLLNSILVEKIIKTKMGVYSTLHSKNNSENLLSKIAIEFLHGPYKKPLKSKAIPEPQANQIELKKENPFKPQANQIELKKENPFREYHKQPDVVILAQKVGNSVKPFEKKINDSPPNNFTDNDLLMLINDDKKEEAKNMKSSAHYMVKNGNELREITSRLNTVKENALIDFKNHRSLIDEIFDVNVLTDIGKSFPISEEELRMTLQVREWTSEEELAFKEISLRILNEIKYFFGYYKKRSLQMNDDNFMFPLDNSKIPAPKMKESNSGIDFTNRIKTKHKDMFL